LDADEMRDSEKHRRLFAIRSNKNQSRDFSQSSGEKADAPNPDAAKSEKTRERRFCFENSPTERVL
jgi:hypothetical protein